MLFGKCDASCILVENPAMTKHRVARSLYFFGMRFECDASFQLSFKCCMAFKKSRSA